MRNLRTRLFQSWFRLSRPMTLGVRAIVEREDGCVLLVRHTYMSGLFLPGGGVEKNETAETALLRELKEEGGVELEGTPRLIGVYSNQHVFPNDHVLLYRLGPASWQQGKATSRGEISEVVWADPRVPPDDISPGTRRRLAEVYGSGDTTGGYW